MFNIPSFFGFRTSSPPDPDALAFFARVDAATGATDFLITTEKFAIDNLVKKMKYDGIWSLMKAIYPFVGGGNGTLAQRQAACSQNLVSSSFTGTFTSTGWTFSSNGVQSNGTAHMNTGLNANIQLNVNSSHLSYYSRNLNTSTGFNVLMGIGSTTCFMQGFGNFLVNANQASSSNSSLTQNPIGFLIGNKQNSTTQQSYKNNFSITQTVTTTAFSTTLQNIFISNYDTGSTFGTDSECAFSSIGDGLSNQNATDFYNAVQTFQTTLARQV